MRPAGRSRSGPVSVRGGTGCFPGVSSQPQFQHSWHAATRDRGRGARYPCGSPDHLLCPRGHRYPLQPQPARRCSSRWPCTDGKVIPTDDRLTVGASPCGSPPIPAAACTLCRSQRCWPPCGQHPRLPPWSMHSIGSPTSPKRAGQQAPCPSRQTSQQLAAAGALTGSAPSAPAAACTCWPAGMQQPQSQPL